MARPKDAAPLTPEEKAARKAKASAGKLTRDRITALSAVQSALSRAGMALASGDTPKHVEWLNAARVALDSYRAFFDLSLTDAEHAWLEADTALD